MGLCLTVVPSVSSVAWPTHLGVELVTPNPAASVGVFSRLGVGNFQVVQDYATP